MQRPWVRSRKVGVTCKSLGSSRMKEETVLGHGHIEKSYLVGPYKLL